jgi:hypothetical protein
MAHNPNLSQECSKESQLHIRLSEGEKAIVRKASAIEKCTMSQFLRGAVMSAAKQIILGINGEVPVFANKEGDYCFKDRPKLNVFSNLYKFRDSGISEKDWVNLYGLQLAHFQYVLNEIGVGGSLHAAYQEWLKTEDEPLAAF